jgi:OPA family glycerol-3-phosphate transporter-like MFS transporter
MMCTGLVRHSLEQWGPAYFLEVQRVQPDSFIFQFAFLGQIFAAVLGSLVLGYLSDKYFQSRRGPVTAIAYIAQAALLLIFGMAKPGPWSAAIILIVLYFFLNGCHGLLAGTASMDFGGRRAAASAAGMLDGSQYLAGSTVGAGMGALLDRYGWNIWAYTVVPLAVIGAVLMATRWRTLPKRAGEAADIKGDNLGTVFACMFLPPLADDPGVRQGPEAGGRPRRHQGHRRELRPRLRRLRHREVGGAGVRAGADEGGEEGRL